MGLVECFRALVVLCFSFAHGGQMVGVREDLVSSQEEVIHSCRV